MRPSSSRWLRVLTLVTIAVLVAGAWFFIRGGGSDGPGASTYGRQATMNPGEPNARDNRSGGAAVGADDRGDDASTLPTVTLDVIVADPAGEPWKDAEVVVYRNDARDLDPTAWRRFASVRTDARGVGQLKVAPGTVLLAARVRDEDAGDARGQKEVELPSGAERKEVRLTVAPASRVEGRVTDAATKQGVAHAMVELLPLGAPRDRKDRPSLPEDERRWAQADAHGRYAVKGVQPGGYQVEITADAYEPWIRGYFMVEAHTQLDVALHGAAFLTGTVVDAKGAPVAGARVWAEGSRPGPAVETGEGGGFSLDVGRGVYRVLARKDALAGALDQQVTAGAGQTVKDLVVTLGAGATLSGVVVARASEEREPAPVRACELLLHTGSERLESRCSAQGTFEWPGLPVGVGSLTVSAPGFAPTIVENLALSAGSRQQVGVELSPNARVSGRVTNTKGEPVAGIGVRARRHAASPGKSALAQTDGDGRYTLHDAPSGEVMLQARREGASAGTDVRVQIAPGERATVDLVLAGTGAVTGQVMRKDGKALGPKTRVRAHNRANRMQRAQTSQLDREGRYRLELPEGEWTVNAADLGTAAWNFQLNAVPVRIVEGETAEADLTIEEEQVACSGTVLEPGGAPARAFVFLEGVRAGTGLASNEEGHFSLSKMQGSGSLFHIAHAHLSGRYGSSLTGPECDGVEVQLEPPARLRGEVRDPSGKPVEGFHLEVHFAHRQLGSMWGAAVQRRFGGSRFHLDDVPGTDVRLVVRTDDQRQASVELTLPPGTETSQDVELVASARISGRLVSAASGESVVPASVMLMPMIQLRQVNARGGFAFEGLAPGDYELHINADGFRGVLKTATVGAGEQLALGDVALEVDRVEPGTIGAVVGTRGGEEVAFSQVKPKSPASAAGVREWDRLLAIDEVPVEDLTDAAMRINGPPGSVVRLTVKRGADELAIEVVRAR